MNDRSNNDPFDRAPDDTYVEAGTDNRQRDAQGRIAAPADMTDREIAEETLLNMRGLADLLNGIAANPMIRAMVPGL